MISLIKIVFILSLFIIFWANIGYPLSILILNKLFPKKLNKNYVDIKPTVTVMVVAHNEETVIEEKLNNLKNLNYPKKNLKIIVSSDNSTDKTNQIVESFINNNLDLDIQLYKVEKRQGKTNAQNEAQKIVDSEFLIMTDANSMLDSNAANELIASFTSNDIAYVTGKLSYINTNESISSQSESTYWNLDLKIRDIESKFQTITAGNGAIYACRNSDYVDFNPIYSHDSSMPIYFGLKQKRAIANHNAIAYEKAGETSYDEFSRKVRMNRVLLKHILPDIRILNIFKYKWFTYFYLGHRTSRYLLWLAHLLLLFTNIFLAFYSFIFLTVLIIQMLFYLCAYLKVSTNIDNKVINLCYYYMLTILAQCVGVYNSLTGKSKPFWEKAESTR